MNQLQKNIALWIVISLVFLFLFHMFNQPQSSKEEIVYSDFINFIDKGQINEVTIKGENVEGKFVDGRPFTTFVPQDSALVPLLQEKGVRISVRPVDGNPWYMTILISWLP
ncbi:MAG: ATP-dependent metallopeptidase FtsH/Yme1/Tma family protein, partial [Deltaproteobacteria bacterium]|nr:ATP-dependent metallopeptidase FtsH/Yme1/Tma family protein [Deltaproteobacteria bacterium]